MDVLGIKRGVFGGTFDPVHNGHLAIAEEARKAAGLTEVYFVPAPRPWQKTHMRLTPVSQRVEMLRLAIKDRPYFHISTVDIDRAGPSYTIDTILDLRREFSPKDEFYFILGWDSLESLPSWKDAARLVQLCYLLAAPRPGYPRPDLRVLDGQLPGISQKVILMDGPVMDISASGIRQRVAEGKSLEGLAPAAVAGYITEKGLYRNPTGFQPG